MKIIFLDIDGVLNCPTTTARVGPGILGIDPELVKNFNRITSAVVDAGIVISSTWRMMFPHLGLGSLESFLAESGVEGVFVGQTRTRMSYATRGQEIEDWLSENPVPDFVILDDVDSGFTPSLSSRHVHTDFRYGLTVADADLAISILGS